MKIPPQAKRVFKGVIFDVYQWEQEMFNGTKQTFEMLKRADTVQIIPVVDGKIIISEEDQPYKGPFITVFGGRVDDGEEQVAAAKRELLEESGYASNDWELLMTNEPYTKIEWTIYTYIARNCKKVQEQNLDAGERITPRLLSFEEFVDFAVSDKFRGRDLSMYIMQLELNGRLDELKSKLSL